MKSSKIPKTMKAFERSKFDKDIPGAKEGSPKDKARDKKQFAAVRRRAK